MLGLGKAPKQGPSGSSTPERRGREVGAPEVPAAGPRPCANGGSSAAGTQTLRQRWLLRRRGSRGPSGPVGRSQPVSTPGSPAGPEETGSRRRVPHCTTAVATTAWPGSTHLPPKRQRRRNGRDSAKGFTHPRVHRGPKQKRQQQAKPHTSTKR